MDYTIPNNEQTKKDIEGYIQRSIPDIARKCGVKQDIVLEVMKSFCLNK